MHSGVIRLTCRTRSRRKDCMRIWSGKLSSEEEGPKKIEKAVVVESSLRRVKRHQARDVHQLHPQACHLQSPLLGEALVSPRLRVHSSD